MNLLKTYTLKTTNHILQWRVSDHVDIRTTHIRTGEEVSYIIDALPFIAVLSQHLDQDIPWVLELPVTCRNEDSVIKISTSTPNITIDNLTFDIPYTLRRYTEPQKRAITHLFFSKLLLTVNSIV